MDLMKSVSQVNLNSLTGSVLDNYVNPRDRSDVGKFNDLIYEAKRMILQRELETLQLSEALHDLHAQQMDAGFIQDDLSQVKTFQCYGPRHGEFFIGQFNPRRADRSKGAGRNIPPLGAKTKNALDPSCFLCANNVRWQQRGVQLYYQFEVNGRQYNALCNPFPFMPVHITIATGIHEPQSWHEPPNTADKIGRIVEDLYNIEEELPKFVGFYNGVGAGATIEKHLHYHFFELPDGHEEFPLQVAAKRAKATSRAVAVPPIRISDDHYPLTSFWMYGDKDEVVGNVVELANKWVRFSGDSASANIIAIWEERKVSIYFVPRNRFFSRSPGMTGIVGGCETLGEFIFCTEWEDQAINEARINYTHMWNILKSVNPPNAHML